MSQLKKGAILSYVNIGLTNLIGLVLTPFIIRSLGDSEYGLYVLIGSLIAYLSLMDLGLNNTIIRFISKYRAEGDRAGEQNFLGTIFLVYIAISLLIVFIGVLFYLNLDSFFSKSLSVEETDKAKVMFQILIFNMAITLPGGAFTAICNAYENFVWPRMVSIIKYISRAIIIVVILSLGGKAISIVITDTILNIIFITITILFVIKKLRIKFAFEEINKKSIKIIFNYSIWIFLLAITSQFIWNAGQVILGTVTDTKTVAYYAVGVMLGSYYGAFSGAISSVFLPRATQMSINNTKSEILNTMIRLGRISLLILLFILTGFILFGREFIMLWVGKNYKSSYTIAVIFMLSYTIPLILSFVNSLVEAYNKVRFKVTVYFIFFPLGLILGYYLSKEYKEIGMMMGVSLGWILAQIVMLIFYHKGLGLNMFVFFKQVSHKIIILVVSIFIVSWILNSYSSSNISLLILKICAYAFLYWVVMYLWGMNESEKKMLKIIKK
ncbi:lipopolysaccharide biosynthesis protein [Epilithonimonas caeni]|uniref:lipopolysaccharide biosynthesis protein n=1 Tax=Epilithonimonas caeni TaxID=365343 RepID=UPI0004249A17|nr:oligosaccharide flippase family protein [Epilithonimonas caeni]